MSKISQHGAITTVQPTLPLQADTIEQLNNQLQAQLRGGVPQVVIDLSETPLIDGAGLEWILDLDETCCRLGGCVRLCAASELCRDILRITSVGAQVQQFDNLTEALGSFA